jgi:hypothetical protein
MHGTFARVLCHFLVPEKRRGVSASLAAGSTTAIVGPS